jgi:hypothetical protein
MEVASMASMSTPVSGRVRVTLGTPRFAIPGGAVALGGLVFATGIIFDNLVRITEPGPSADIASVLRWYAANSTIDGIALGLFPINLVALFVFVYGITSRANDDAATVVWGRLARGAMLLIAAFFAMTSLFDAVLAAQAHALTSEPALATTIWRLHWTIFTINLAAIGTTMFFVSLFAMRSALVGRVFLIAASVGSAVLLGSASAVLPAAGGVPVFYAALPGFLMWIVFLAVLSLRAWQADRG